MSRRWQRGEIGHCRCARSPIGPDPATVIRGGTTPTLKRGGIEHICPTAEHVARPPGRKSTGEGGTMLGIVVTPALKERIQRAAGGAGKVSDWARTLLEAGCETVEADATKKRR